MKISVILPTNKKNSKEELDRFHEVGKIVGDRRNTYLNGDFTQCCRDYVYDFPEDACGHVLSPTIRALRAQIFDDFEVLICHRYPDDIEEFLSIFDETETNAKLRVIKEKPSIWHEFGDEYRTVNNIRNTGIIEAKGELLLFLDDYTIFNENLLQQAWDAYKDGYYITARGMRRIRYDPKAKSGETPTRRDIADKGIRSSYNFNNINDGDIIPNSATWTYCCTVSLEETLKVNGFDEVWDGNFGGTDQDFGRRLARVSDYKRKLMGTIYEFAHKSARQELRNDEILRQICGQMFPTHVRANEWKPTEQEMRRYKRWHESNIGYLNPLWNRFLDVEMYDLRELRNISQI